MKQRAVTTSTEVFAPNEDIHVTRSVLPPREVYEGYLADIFSTRQLSNEGKYTRELEKKLERVVGVQGLSLCVNGTLALQLAIRLFGLQGKKVITTPFTYVATASALLWEHCVPVFADIDEDTLCLSPRSVSNLLDDDVAGILPVHIYGNACDVQAFAELAGSRRIVCLYDAAQATGSKLGGRSLLSFGDAAACSFHATKVFHTVEGGGVVTQNAKDKQAIGLLRAFGHRGDEHFFLGINGKMSELHAIMGLSLLPMMPDIISARRKISELYDSFWPLPGLRRPIMHSDLEYNYAYYPVLFENPDRLRRVVLRMREQRIFPRRYFYPAINTLEYMPLKYACPIAEATAVRALCLPLYSELAPADVERIVDIIRATD